MKECKILVVNVLWPYPKHNQAANVILFELIIELAKQHGVKVDFLKIDIDGDLGLSDDEKNGILLLKSHGINILPSLRISKSPPRSKWRRVFFPTISDFYPGVTPEIKNIVNDKVLLNKPDVLFLPCNEWLTALCSDIPITKYAYYGNPDPKSASARAEFDRSHGNLGLLQYMVKRLMIRQLEQFHIKEMIKYEIVGELALNDVNYYIERGLKNVSYINNVWIDRFPNWREERNKIEQKNPPIIVGNVGRLSATANTHGLDLLGREYLSSLRAVMHGRSYEIHLFGYGHPHPAIAEALRKPEVHLRGFVDDIDREIFRAQVFLCLNNASAYKVGHTRYLHAWSLGCCVVAHRDASLSMPEIVHGKNALLGDSVEEIAKLTKQAINDPVLRSKLGAAGYETFKQYFTAEKVAPKIMGSINDYLKTHVR